VALLIGHDLFGRWNVKHRFWQSGPASAHPLLAPRPWCILPLVIVSGSGPGDANADRSLADGA